MRKFSTLTLDNSFSELDPSLISHVLPQPLQNPRLVATSPQLSKQLNIDPQELTTAEFLHFVNGETLLDHSKPIATKYTGHQFGIYNPDLGDGRAILLGELMDAQGVSWELQLKGAGQTPYSRFADGRAVLRSSIREFLASEALHALGIPTSRALALIASDTPVYRERVETGAMLLRVAPTHIRFGHFEYLAHTQQHDALKQLTHYVIERHYPQYHHGQTYDYLGWFSEIVKKNAELMAQWLAFGFAHGVMNTDNMSILSITFDYGPFGFVDDYDPHYICNHSDHQGRYALDEQPGIMLWNLHALALALQPIINKSDLDNVLSSYRELFFNAMDMHMRAKLGLIKPSNQDRHLFTTLLTLMAKNRVDYTTFFRDLSQVRIDADSDFLTNRFMDRDGFQSWLKDYKNRLIMESSVCEQRQQQMNLVNPKYILRNYLAQIAIEKAEQGDYREVNQLHHVLQSPFAEQPQYEQYAQPPPEWGKQLNISCSS